MYTFCAKRLAKGQHRRRVVIDTVTAAKVYTYTVFVRVIHADVKNIVRI